MNRYGVCMVGAVLLFACGGSGDDDEDSGGGDTTTIVSGPLSGKIGGQPWTLIAAETDSFLSEENDFFVTAYAEPITACSNDFGSGASMTVILPKATGDHQIGVNKGLLPSFSVPNADVVFANKGHIRIDSISDTLITGGAFIEADANNTLNGEFTATICP